MLIVGLTGSIGMGKSTAAARFREHGIAVFDADAEVHRLYAGPIAVEIEQVFPGVTEGGVVNRAKLSQQLLGNPDRFKNLESIVHPRIRESERRFVQEEHARGAPIAVLEVPLLFEAGGFEKVDVIIVVSASSEVRRARVLPRPGMTETKFETIVHRQLSEAEKKKRADFVVDTNGTVANCNSQIDLIVGKLRERQGQAYDHYWRD
ncbi:dephospho-CoA kinase [Hyphomicrobium sp.]|jgi:dephospho-CoA kinase|uniref:dephospho-CoA kinase n=1 Tax=Hyphomicrobium sp. TaxID=82 RepID=UPI002B9057B8|nr:dephospho-CoA kinase [Hyphomicrobium sp.]HVZ04920.1 dephospho-CoA kinase [Hyphomicrobium sp.]